MSHNSEQPNASAVEAINKKLTEVTALADRVDALRFEVKSNNPGRNQSPEDGRSESEDFVTASECTCTPQSRSSSYHTASECGTSPWLEQEKDVSDANDLNAEDVETRPRLIREITETRMFQVKQCHIAPSASLLRTADEFVDSGHQTHSRYEREVSEDAPDYAWGKYYHSYMGKQALKGCL